MTPLPGPGSSISRRAVIGPLAGVAAAGALTGCQRGGLSRRRRRRKPTQKPTGAKAKDPTTPLVVGSVGTTFGLAAQFEAQIAAAIEEARIDIDTNGGIFQQKLTMLPRIMVESPQQDMAEVVRQLKDQGATAAVVSCGDAELMAAMEHFARADIAVISPNSTAMALREDAALDNGLLFRLAPNDAALATTYAKDAAGGGSDGIPLTVGLCTRDGSLQSASMLSQLQRRLNGHGGRADVYLHPAEPFDAGPMVDLILAAPPAVLVLNGGPESISILAALAAKNRDERGQPILRLDVRTGYYSSLDYGQQLPPEAMKGFKGGRVGRPMSEPVGGAFYDQMLNANLEFLHTGCDFSQEAYDALMMIAFAAQSAHSAAGTQIAAAIPGLLDDGEECEEANVCINTLMNRQPITYVARSGDLEFGPDRDLAKGEITTFSYNDANLPDKLQSGSVAVG